MSVLPIRHALRSLRRTPAFSITATLTLVIGIGATVAIFAVVNGVLLHPLPFGSPDRLAGAWHDLPPLSLTHAQQTPGTYRTYKALAHTIEGIALYQQSAVNIGGSDGGEPQRITSARITASLIPLLQVPPQLGRNVTDAEDSPNGPDVVIISDALWRTRFGGDRSVIGRKLDVNGVSREIVGVMPPHFRFPTSDTRLWVPLRLNPSDQYPGGFNYDGIVRLKPGVTVAQAQRDFTEVLPRIVELSPNLAPGISTQMLLDQAKPRPLLIPLLADMTRDIAKPLWMIAAAAVLVLLVACFNVANLMLVRADARQRELAVREALGAGRSRVLAHFLAESAVLSGTAAILGLAVAWLCVRALVVTGGASDAVAIPRLSEVSIDGASVVFTFVVAAIVAFLCSAVPALRIGRVRLSHALREGGRTGTATRVQHRVRGALVAAQIALALVVLSASGVLLRTFQQLRAVKPGFDPEHVATFWMSLPGGRYKEDESVARFYSTLTARVAALPGVRAAGVTSLLPLEGRGMSQDPLYPENDSRYANKIPPLQLYISVDSGYFGVMGIPLIAGRTFRNLTVQSPGEAIVSQETAKHFWNDASGRSVIGKRFRELPTGPLFTVIGVVGSVRDTALSAAPSQTLYLPEAAIKDTAWRGFDHLAWTMALVVKTAGDPAAITTSVQRLIRELDPTLPTFDVRPMSTVLRASVARLSFITVILGAAAVVTLLLGAIGLYGVMAYLVALRVKELSVRIALGAQPSAVAAMMTRHGLVLSAAGVVVGLVGFALVARFLRSFLYGVAPHDPLALSAASLTLIAIAALATWIPARRASRVDPAEALRAE
jgi:predicted permease